MADATFLPCFAKGKVKRPEIPGRKKIQKTYHEAMEQGRFLEKSIGDAIYNLKEAKKDLEEKVKSCLRDILTSINGQLPTAPRAILFAKNVIDFIKEEAELIDEIASTVAALVQCINVLASMIRNMKLMLQSIMNALSNLLAEICNWNLPDLPSIPNLSGLFHYKFPGFNLQGALANFDAALKFPVKFTFPTCRIKLPTLPKLPPVNLMIPVGPGGTTLTIDNQVTPTASTPVPSPSGGPSVELPVSPELGGPIVSTEQASDPVFRDSYLTPPSGMPYYPDTFNPLTDILGSVPDPSKLLNTYEMPPNVYQNNLVSMIEELRTPLLPPDGSSPLGNPVTNEPVPLLTNEGLSDQKRREFMGLLKDICNLEKIMSLSDNNTGNTGNTGSVGNTGNMGNTGNTGNTGSTGSVGNTGNMGNTGNTGNTGSVGNMGNTGNTGSGNTGNTDRINKAASWLLMMNNSRVSRKALWIKEYQDIFMDKLAPSIKYIQENPTPFNSLESAPKDLPFFNGLTNEMLWKLSYLEASLLHWPRSTKWDTSAVEGYPVILDFEQTGIGARDQELVLDSDGLSDYPVTLLVYTGYLHQVQDAIKIASSDILNNANWRTSRPQFRFIYDQFGMSTEVDRFSQFWREWKQNFEDMIDGEDVVSLPYILNYGTTINSRCNPLANSDLYDYLHYDAIHRNPNWIPGWDIINIPHSMAQPQDVGEPKISGWEGNDFNAEAFLSRPDIKVLPLTVQHAMLEINMAYAGVMKSSAANQAAADKQIGELKALAGTSMVKGFKVSGSKDQSVILGVKTLLKFDTTTTDIVNVVTASNLFTIQDPGEYTVTGEFIFAPSALPYERKIEMWINGAPISVDTSPKVIDSVTISLNHKINLKAKDTVQVYAYHTGAEANNLKAGFSLSALMTDTSSTSSIEAGATGSNTVNSGGTPPVGSTKSNGGTAPPPPSDTGNVSGVFDWGVVPSGQKIYAAATPVASLTAVYTNQDSKILPIHPEVNSSDIPFFDGVTLGGATINQTVSVALMYGQEYKIATTAIIPPNPPVNLKVSKLSISSQVSDSVPITADGTQGVPRPIGNLEIGKILFVGPGGSLTQDFNYVKANCRWIVAAGRATAKDMFIFEPHVPMDQQLGVSPGPPIGGYVHTQTTSATVWTINHNLGRYVNVEVYDADNDSIVRDLTFVDLNTCVVRLVVPTTGHAACV